MNSAFHAKCCDLNPYVGIRANYRPMLEAFGMWQDDYNDFQISALARHLMNDPHVEVLSQLEGCFTWLPDPFEDIDENGDLLPEGAPRNKVEHSSVADVHYDKIAERMGEQGCAELRERIKSKGGARVKK